MKFEDAIIKVLEKIKIDEKEHGLPLWEIHKVKIGKNDINKVMNYLNHKNFLVKNGDSYRINHFGIDYVKELDENRAL